MIEAESGLLGLDALDQQPPALVLLDIMMPGIDGFQVMKYLAQFGVKVPVLAMSALGERVEERARELGADGFVAKPFDIRELVVTQPPADRAAAPRQRRRAAPRPPTDRDRRTLRATRALLHACRACALAREARISITWFGPTRGRRATRRTVATRQLGTRPPDEGNPTWLDRSDSTTAARRMQRWLRREALLLARESECSTVSMPLVRRSASWTSWRAGRFIYELKSA